MEDEGRFLHFSWLEMTISWLLWGRKMKGTLLCTFKMVCVKKKTNHDVEENTGQRENVNYKPLLNLWRFIYFCSQMTNIDFTGCIVEALSSELQPLPLNVPEPVDRGHRGW